MTDHRIYMQRSFDAGHRIVGHKGKCARLHGHTYHVEVGISSPSLVRPGFVIDFGDIKEIIDQWDHVMLLWSEDPVVVGMKAETFHPANEYLSESKAGIVRLSFNPTAENMATHLAEEINLEIPHAKSGVKVILWETPSACAIATAGHWEWE